MSSLGMKDHQNVMETNGGVIPDSTSGCTLISCCAHTVPSEERSKRARSGRNAVHARRLAKPQRCLRLAEVVDRFGIVGAARSRTYSRNSVAFGRHQSG